MEDFKRLEEDKLKRFYRIRDNTNYSRGWLYAYKIYPLSEEQVNDCQVCGRIGRYPKREFAVDVEGGKKFPDILECAAYPLMIVSKDVIDAWKTEGISGFSAYPVTVRNMSSPKEYYHVVVEGRCEPDLEKMGFKIVKQCESCSAVTYDKPIWSNDNFAIKEETWDGKDLFTARYFPAIVLCSERVLETAKKYKHTNCRIVPLEDAQKIGVKSLV